jgi:DNA replication protein DnaC
MKAPTMREAVARLAQQARAEPWTPEEFLVACLQREVSAREAQGGEGRIRAARFPSRKSLEEFDFDHARGLKRDSIAVSRCGRYHRWRQRLCAGAVKSLGATVLTSRPLDRCNRFG